MGSSASNTKPPRARRAHTHTPAVPAPYQLAIEDTAFATAVLERHVPRDFDCDQPLIAPAWFAVTVTGSTQKRFLYLVQHESDTGLIVILLLFDRTGHPGDTSGLRLPASGGWLRAVVDGTLSVLASDLVLSHKAITAWAGAREPPAGPARPPYT